MASSNQFRGSGGPHGPHGHRGGGAPGGPLGVTPKLSKDQFGGPLNNLNTAHPDVHAKSGSPSYFDGADPGIHGGRMTLDVSGRNASTASMNSLHSTPHTPISQGPPPPGYTLHQFGSVSSVATTDDEDMCEPTYPWTPEDDAHLKKVFEGYKSDPMNAPFSGRFPPSGVVQRVSKNALKYAARDRIVFPHKINAVRKRLLLLCDAPEDPALDKLVPYGPIPTTGDPNDMDTEFISDEFIFNDAPTGMHPGEKYSQTTLGDKLHPVILPVDVGSGAAANYSVPLASPFKEHFDRPKDKTPDVSPHDDTDAAHILNIVAKRKRDSLKMKRGLK